MLVLLVVGRVVIKKVEGGKVKVKRIKVKEGLKLSGFLKGELMLRLP